MESKNTDCHYNSLLAANVKCGNIKVKKKINVYHTISPYIGMMMLIMYDTLIIIV